MASPRLANETPRVSIAKIELSVTELRSIRSTYSNRGSFTIKQRRRITVAVVGSCVLGVLLAIAIVIPLQSNRDKDETSIISTTNGLTQITQVSTTMTISITTATTAATSITYTSISMTILTTDTITSTSTSTTTSVTDTTTSISTSTSSSTTDITTSTSTSTTTSVTDTTISTSISTSSSTTAITTSTSMSTTTSVTDTTTSTSISTNSSSTAITTFTSTSTTTFAIDTTTSSTTDMTTSTCTLSTTSTTDTTTSTTETTTTTTDTTITETTTTTTIINSILYAQNITSSGNITIQCSAWGSFVTQLIPQVYQILRMYGSADPNGIALTNSTYVSAIASALRNSSSYGPITSNNRTWRVFPCGSGFELTADGSTCQCRYPGYAFRACYDAPRFGGFNNSTCNGPAQSIFIEFQY